MNAPYPPAQPPAGEAIDPEAGAPAGHPSHSLLARLAGLRGTVSALVEHRSATDPTADDPLRGLYLSEDAVRHLVRTWPAPDPDGGMPPDAPAGWPQAPDDRLAGTAARLRLTELDATILLIALAPDIDRTFEPLYGYLNDDVSRRRATIGLVLDLCGVPVHLPDGRARFHTGAPLRALGLLDVEEPERPFLTRSLKLPDRLVSHLLGDDTPDAALLGLLRPMPDPRAAEGSIFPCV